MKKTYPVILYLEGRRCVLVGGGKSAEHKIKGLLNAKADLFVVAPEATSTFHELASGGKIELELRPFQPSDLDGAMIVIAATDDIAINTAVWNAARERNILMNSVDDVPRCDFIAPAIARQGPVAVAISTNGTSPALAAHLRRKMETIMGPEIGVLAEVLGGMRPQVMDAVDGVDQRIKFWNTLVNDDLIELTRHEGREAAQTHVEKFLADWIDNHA